MLVVSVQKLQQQQEQQQEQELRREEQEQAEELELVMHKSTCILANPRNIKV